MNNKFKKITDGICNCKNAGIGISKNAVYCLSWWTLILYTHLKYIILYIFIYNILYLNIL